MSKIHQDRRGLPTNNRQGPDMPCTARLAAAKNKQISIGIVGAGLAGLRCADILLQYGFKVTILEARNRLGGRVAQSDHLGHSVDLGPNWIHGTDDNPIMELAQRTGTEMHSWEEEAHVLDGEGKTLSPAAADQYSELLWDNGVIADAFRISNQYQDTIDPRKSLYDYFFEKAEEMFAIDPVVVAKQKRATFLQFAEMWGCYIGSPVTRQSLKFFWLEECIEGENPFVAGTYRKILEAVAQPAQSDADIHLDCEVVKVCSNHMGQEQLPHVATAEGKTFSFDEVVVTAPLGWLKRNTAAFEPGLPTRLSQAIGNISYGTLDKVYITFPSAFWDSPESQPRRSAVNMIDSHPTLTAKTTSNKNATHHPGFTHWLQPGYAQSTNPQQWAQEAMNLAALPSTCAHPTLLFYIQGPQSKYIADLVDSAKSDQDRDAMLVEFFEPYYSLLPNYAPSDPNCIPKAVLATAWANDKFAGYGSYSNFQVGLEKGDEDIEVMRHGMPDRHLWMAGEHTAPFVALGTSTGAYWSGEAVGERIAEAYGLSEKAAPS